jgi:type IV pilus assembly protein PilA
MRKKGFTLIEVMVVILIVAILAAVLVPIMQGRIDSAKWSEAKASMGSIATAIRAYAAEQGANFNAAQVNGTLSAGNPNLGLADGDCDGTYFSDACYVISGAAYDPTNGVSFIITATANAAENGRKYPTKPQGTNTLTVTNNGAAQWGW